MSGAKRVAAGLLLPGIFASSLLAVQVGNLGAQIRVSETSFDKSNFGQLTVIAARNKAEDSLQTYLTMIDQDASLSDQQRDKLRLAGRLDIHRFFADYARAKRGFAFGRVAVQGWQEELLRLRTAVRPLADRYVAGLHDESSLFSKTLYSTLDADQRLVVERLFRERKRARYQHLIRLTLAMIDYRLPLTEQERTTITELLLTKTEPPGYASSSVGLVFLVLGQMASIEDELRDHLSDEDLAVLVELIRTGQESAKKP